MKNNALLKMATYTQNAKIADQRKRSAKATNGTWSKKQVIEKIKREVRANA